MSRTKAILKHPVAVENVPYGEGHGRPTEVEIRGVKLDPIWSRACAEFWSHVYGFDVRPGAEVRGG